MADVCNAVVRSVQRVADVFNAVVRSVQRVADVFNAVVRSVQSGWLTYAMQLLRW